MSNMARWWAKVYNVEDVKSGDELAADAGVGASTLTVEDTTDFSESGGRLKLVSEEIDYTSVNMETNVITLTTVTVGAYVTGDSVWVYPTQIERYAHVRIEDDDDESVLVLVPTSMHQKMTTGIRRSRERETVQIRKEGGMWTVRDIRGREPTPGTQTLIWKSYTPVDTVLGKAIYHPRGGTVTGVRASMSLAPASQATADVLFDGVTIFPTTAKPKVKASEFVSDLKEPDIEVFTEDTKIQAQWTGIGAATGIGYIYIDYFPED